MVLLFVKIFSHTRDSRSSSGSVLPIVLVFAAFALIVASLYVGAQYTIGKPALAGPAAFQSLCNARSGIWKGMQLLSQRPPDTLASINTLDSMFNKQLFGKQITISTDSGSYFMPGDTPTLVQPYSTDSFGTAYVSLDYQPCYKVLVSKGEFRNISKNVRALLGGKVYASADTVCFLQSGTAPAGGLIEGKTVIASSPAGPSPQLSSPSKVAPSIPQTTPHTPEQLRLSELSKVVTYYRGLLSEKTDTTLPGRPLTLQSGDNCASIPEVVNGPLFLSSMVTPLVWSEKRRVFVFGDIQISGTTSIEDVELVTTGEVKLFDECKLHNVSVFSLGRLVVGDKASFSGNALVLQSVLVYKDASINERSVIVCYSENNAIPSDTTQKNKPKNPVSIFLRNNATIDGVVISCGNPGGISTDKNVVVKGILWASGPIVHQGSLFGILRAAELADPQILQERMNGIKLPSKIPSPVRFDAYPV